MRNLGFPLPLVLFLFSFCNFVYAGEYPITNNTVGSITLTVGWNGGPICNNSNCTQSYLNYSCSNGVEGDWAGGLKTFLDPVPMGNLLRGVNISLVGKFFCDPDEQISAFVATINDLVVAVDSSKEVLKGCGCETCWSSVNLNPVDLNEDFYSQYHYNSSNAFQLVLISNDICVSYVNITFVYTPLEITKAAPLYGPLSGGTPVTLTGGGWTNDSISLWQCRFGAGTTPVALEYISDTQVVCISPPYTTAKPVALEITPNGNYFISTPFYFTYEATTPPDSLISLAHDFWWAIVIIGGVVVALLILIILNFRFKKKTGMNQPLLSASFGSYNSTDSIALGEILLGERIGRGNFGEVFKGYWHGTLVAVKKTKLPGVASEGELSQLLEDFEREAAIMRSLRHPNVLQFLGICKVSGGAEICIIMEFMPQGSLYRILHDMSLDIPWELRLRMAVDVSKGMNYLHKSSPMIIHRDLKSHNLLLDENFKVKISDFGLAKLINGTSQASLTSCGTPAWTAPEGILVFTFDSAVLRNERYTESADVYGFAIVLWELVTREEPHKGVPPFQVIFAVGTQRARPLIPPTCPGEFGRLIEECWAENPLHRPDFDEIMTRLEGMLADEQKKNKAK